MARFGRLFDANVTDKLGALSATLSLAVFSCLIAFVQRVAPRQPKSQRLSRSARHALGHGASLGQLPEDQ